MHYAGIDANASFVSQNPLGTENHYTFFATHTVPGHVPQAGVMAASSKHTEESQAGTQKRERGNFPLSPIPARHLGANAAWSWVPYALQRTYWLTELGLLKAPFTKHNFAVFKAD